MSEGEVTAPLVSVVIANFNGARFLRPAVVSALEQDLRSLEVIVVDDASDDESATIAECQARDDPRVRVLRDKVRRGPGAARNQALDLARGRWIAILDNDDLMHPARLSQLLWRAKADGAEIVADDQVAFQDGRSARPRRFLSGRRARTPTWLTADAFALETRLDTAAANLGYLKPMIDAQAWRASGVRYDERLAVGEDQDLLLRLLMAGLRCRIDPFIGYLYRKHSGSTSYRLGQGALTEMARANDALDAASGGADPRLRRALRLRRRAMQTTIAFTASIDALKARRWALAAAAVARRPRAALLYRWPLLAAAERAVRSAKATLAHLPFESLHRPIRSRFRGVS
jgi:succinoglycan biosynthesis protein ExoO